MLQAPTVDLDSITTILERYISPVNARALVQRTLRESNFRSKQLTAGELRALREPLRRGLKLFARQAECEQALDEIERLCDGEPARSSRLSIPIKSEPDISTARNEARRICLDLGAKNLTTHMVATIVSELARNITSYTVGGAIELTTKSEPRRIVVCARDSGPGIANLDHILSGRYQSKTGLGRGIIGTKRLAHSFDISTTAAGTIVTAEIAI